jgi:hypothetical protein
VNPHGGFTLVESPKFYWRESRCEIQILNSPDFVSPKRQGVATESKALALLPQRSGGVAHMVGHTGGIRILIIWCEEMTVL